MSAKKKAPVAKSHGGGLKRPPRDPALASSRPKKMKAAAAGAGASLLPSPGVVVAGTVDAPPPAPPHVPTVEKEPSTPAATVFNFFDEMSQRYNEFFFFFTVLLSCWYQ